MGVGGTWPAPKSDGMRPSVFSLSMIGRVPFDVLPTFPLPFAMASSSAAGGLMPESTSASSRRGSVMLCGYSLASVHLLTKG